jgi:hypothetical protein
LAAGLERAFAPLNRRVVFRANSKPAVGEFLTYRIAKKPRCSCGTVTGILPSRIRTDKVFAKLQDCVLF